MKQIKTPTANYQTITSLKHTKRQSIIHTTRAIKKVKLLQVTMEFQKELIEVQLKDHQQNFSSNPRCRLINPAKNEIGKIIKYFLERLNSKVRDLSSVNQWQKKLP